MDGILGPVVRLAWAGGMQSAWAGSDAGSLVPTVFSSSVLAVCGGLVPTMVDGLVPMVCNGLVPTVCDGLVLAVCGSLVQTVRDVARSIRTR